MRRTLPSIVAALSIGCGSATVYTTDGATYTGDIRAGSRYTLILADGARTAPTAEDAERPAPEPFTEAVIERSRFADIDHPGNGLMVAGALGLALGGAVLVGALGSERSPPRDDEPDDDAVHGGPAFELDFDFDLGPALGIIAGIGFAGAGLGMLVGGIVEYGDSTAAADPRVSLGPGSVVLSGRF